MDRQGGNLTASLGGAAVLTYSHTMDALALIKAADTALHQAKSAGRSPVIVAPHPSEVGARFPRPAQPH